MRGHQENRGLLMISLIDCTSRVRHACFDAITALGQSVNVFYSPESFVNSGVLFRTDVLILGTTRFCRTESEPLRWASVVCPELKTILLVSNGIELCLLSDACNAVSSSHFTTDSASQLDVLKTALGAHCVPSTGGASQPSHQDSPDDPDLLSVGRACIMRSWVW